METNTSPSHQSTNMRREIVNFTVGGARVEAELYLPDPERFPPPWAATVTGPGFAGVKEMLLESYASVQAGLGVACLCVDYRRWGASQGHPRQDLSPELQLQDLRAGLDFLETRADIDPSRLGVWGTSMAGGHAVALSAIDSRVKAAVALIPFLHAPKPKGIQLGVWSAIAIDAIRRAAGAAPGTIAVFAERSGMPAVMTSDGGWEWMQSVAAAAPNYRNEVTIRSLLKVLRYRPDQYAEKIRIPLRLISAANDTITPAEPIRSFARRLKCSHDLIEFEGSHFELFGPHLPETASLTAAWFREKL